LQKPSPQFVESHPAKNARNSSGMTGIAIASAALPLSCHFPQEIGLRGHPVTASHAERPHLSQVINVSWVPGGFPLDPQNHTRVPAHHRASPVLSVPSRFLSETSPARNLESCFGQSQNPKTPRRS
jgi:hypothetical protein